MGRSLYRCIVITGILFIILGCVYPLFVTLTGRIFFPEESNGGIIYKDNKSIGAKLIGQNFFSPKYFHGRPSAAGEKGYDGLSSSPSNLATTNIKLYENIKSETKKILKENPTIKISDIPNDLVNASGSGLDPHISLQAALLQIPRVAHARKMSEDKLKTLIYSLLEKPALGIIGEENINVLLLNILVDEAKNEE
ncbi:potassium-transporting ATPase subunit KdpC [Fluviispira sanaruensis]|uniref:Potassium-transporting ATPase KdpC subunit n=1 Tax=Fluviispira sanaruensis TaxID=2493639 RepID=A0A4V0P2G8_FLUSA|nr:potassium-transporting ATPase subunit KdpC [Fluviispira sanaruensis]BBH53177.1 potassium-transporting ATPase subunit KdpC [Fluviispira sanaruensis]